MNWISIKDQVPEFEHEVLTTDGTYQNVAERVRTTKHGEVFTLGGVGEDQDAVTVTHWMELPELPGKNAEPSKPQVMRTDSKPGDKIVFSFPENGYPHDREYAKAMLVLGQVHTLRKIEVGDCHTHVWLEGFVLPFNSVQFSNAPETVAWLPCLDCSNASHCAIFGCLEKVRIPKSI
jgi:hypothetical protein